MPSQDDNLEASESSNAEWKPSIHERLIMISLSIISLMISLDATIIITSLSAIVTHLRGTATQGFWIGTSYLLTCAVTMPFVAAVSDIFGRPFCLLASLCVFTVGSIICSVAHSLSALLVGRCVQGIGGGGIIILSLVIFTDIVPLRFRPKYYGIIQAAWALGTCIGPVIGGALVQHTTWRWVFYIMFPFCFIGFATIPWVLTLKPRTSTLKQKLRRVDWLGGTLFITSSTAFLVAVSWGGTQYHWGSYQTLVPLFLGAAGTIAALAWEGYGAKEPFLRRSLFHCTSSFAAYGGTIIQGLLLYGQLYYIPFYFLSVKQASPVRTGVDLLPVTCSLVPGSIIAGAIITRVNHFRWAIWSGWVVTTLACGLTILWNIDTSTAAWAAILVLLGFGHALVLNAQNFATQAICHPNDEAAAAAMYAFLRSFGMAIGVGIGGSIFQNVMKVKLKRLGLPEELALNAESYIATLQTLPESTFKTGVLESYVYGFRGVYGCFCGISGLAGLASVLIGHFDMNKDLNTEHKLQESKVAKAFRLPTLHKK